jgi:hypothetical protein
MDIKKYLDIKTIFILILATALILSFIFRRGKTIDNHQVEKDLLEQENKSLKRNNDSISNVNKVIDNYIKLIADSLVITKQELSKVNDKIKKLENKRNGIHKNIDNLNVNGVETQFSDYINGK